MLAKWSDGWISESLKRPKKQWRPNGSQASMAPLNNESGHYMQAEWTLWPTVLVSPKLERSALEASTGCISRLNDVTFAIAKVESVHECHECPVSFGGKKKKNLSDESSSEYKKIKKGFGTRHDAAFCFVRLFLRGFMLTRYFTKSDGSHSNQIWWWRVCKVSKCSCMYPPWC